MHFSSSRWTLTRGMNNGFGICALDSATRHLRGPTQPGDEAGPLHTLLSALVQWRFSLCLLHRAAVMRHLARAKSIISIITLVVTTEKAVPKIILVTLTG